MVSCCEVKELYLRGTVLAFKRINGIATTYLSEQLGRLRTQ